MAYCASAQSPGGKCLQYLVYVPTDTAVDLDPILREQDFQTLGNRPADQGLNLQFRELAGTLFGLGIRQRVLATGRLCALGNFGHQELTGDIEDRRNSALPDWYGDFHVRS